MSTYHSLNMLKPFKNDSDEGGPSDNQSLQLLSHNMQASQVNTSTVNMTKPRTQAKYSEQWDTDLEEYFKVMVAKTSTNKKVIVPEKDLNAHSDDDHKSNGNMDEDVKEKTAIEIIAIKKLLMIAAKIIAIETSIAVKGA